jgi:hypothetical protein
MTTIVIENGQEYQVEINSYGDKYWYQNDQLHRLDGPAVEWANGDKFWYQNDQLHRLDGPAYESANGEKYYFIKDIEYSKEEFDALFKQKQEELEYRSRPLLSRFSKILGN